MGADAAFGRRDECYLVTGTILSHENSELKGLLFGTCSYETVESCIFVGRKRARNTSGNADLSFELKLMIAI